MLLSALNALVILTALRATEEAFIDFLATITILTGTGKHHCRLRSIRQGNLNHLLLHQ
jgi:hypothetical protein